MATTLSEPAGGLPAPPLGSRPQFAAGFNPARPDDKLGRLQREIEAVDRANGPAEHEISFGHFRLLPARRLLLEHDKPVRLGSRALDILIALVERPRELVSKSELIAKVWPDTFVVEGNLKVNIAKLRRALGDGQAGNRYISTVTGRGYCFVAPVTRSVGPCPPTPQRSAAEPSNNVPAPLMRFIGRDEAINRISAQLWHHRLMTSRSIRAIHSSNWRRAQQTNLHFWSMRAVRIRPMSEAEALQNAVRGQYAAGTVMGKRANAYREKPDVASDSTIETFIACQLNVANWRWAGVPFYLRTGK